MKINQGHSTTFIAGYNDHGEPQSLEAHLLGVAENASRRFPQSDYGYLTGLLHDIGKYSQAFQVHVRPVHGEAVEYGESDISGKVDHSSAGAQYALRLFREIAGRTQDDEVRRLSELIVRIVGHCIAGHHSGLLNGISSDDSPSLDRRLKKAVEAYDANLSAEIVKKAHALVSSLLAEENLDFVCRWIQEDGAICGRDAFSLQFAIRMLFSAVVDADRLHSEETRNCAQWAVRQATKVNSLPELRSRLEDHLSTLNTSREINRIRNQVSAECRKAAQEKPGFFDLTVPTGGGKTFASMRFALHHAICHGMRRIIYVIPYTSIIDQNADEFRKVFDSDGRTRNVLEHHSNLEPKKETPESRLLAENWDAPIVITTSVQFFESLYTNKATRCRRLHSIRNSVIILDEVQTVPVRYLQAITWALEELVANHGCTVVLCTATQPVLDSVRIDGEGALDNHRIGLINVRSIVRDPAGLYKSLKRVQVIPVPSTKPLSVVEVAEQIRARASKRTSILSIVNTKRNAAALFAELKDDVALEGRLFHLSTAMCPQHRRDVMEIVKNCAAYARKVGTHAPILVSTQLVEAGVNLDFDVVFRAMAGVDSIAQAAGRCNREGALLPTLGKTYVYEAEEQLGSLIDIIEAKRAGLSALSAIENDPNLASNEKDPIGLIAVQEYFERLYWSRRGEMDKQKIIARLSACRDLEHAADIPFAAIAEDFKLIKEDTLSVLVPYGTEGKRLIADLKRGGHLGLAEIRVPGQYAVNVYRAALPRFASIIEETPAGWLVVDSSKHYTEVGLQLPETLGVEDYIL